MGLIILCFLLLIGIPAVIWLFKASFTIWRVLSFIACAFAIIVLFILMCV